VNLTRLIEQKAEAKDLQRVMDEKVSRPEALAQWLPRKDFEEVRMKTETLAKISHDTVSKHRKYLHS